VNSKQNGWAVHHGRRGEENSGQQVEWHYVQAVLLCRRLEIASMVSNGVTTLAGQQ
jgi:hypothetical protein